LNADSKSYRQFQPTAEFSLIDHYGRSVTNADYFGLFPLVYFGFTRCKVVCPRALSRISSIIDSMGELAAKLKPLYVSVDPERDTPEVMKRFLELDYPMITGLTGTQEQVESAKMAFRVFAKASPDPDDTGNYLVPHSSLIYLLDTQGKYLAHFGDALPVEQVQTRLKSIIS